jgi:hypothetical protein
MVTAIQAPNASFPNSAAFYVSSGDTQGFIDDQACVTQDGYGYNGRASQVRGLDWLIYEVGLDELECVGNGTVWSQ